MTFGAAEELRLDEALALQPETAAWVRSILDRVDRVSPLPARARILELGAAQGRGLAELVRLGHTASGIEPWAQARETAAELALQLGVSFDLRDGFVEQIPFADEQFDLVIATSVMEHVVDLEQSLREVIRVLKPGGMFWFNSASAMCPRQFEIRAFPLFGWYPDRLKKRIMRWAVDRRPALVGNTSMPGIHWWTNRLARKRLGAAGFGRVWTRWELRLPDDHSTRVARVVRTIGRSRALQRIADVVIPGCSYAARKPSPPRG